MDQQLAGETGDAASTRLSAIGKYQLIARLGQGGMATVYLALVAGPAGFNKLLVVKVLRNDVMGGSEDGIRMFWNEARLAAQLVHPNIVHTFEVGQAEGRYFLAMEYLEGQTLRSVQDRAAPRGGIGLHDALRILAEAARGLHYSHELKNFKGEPLGVVHRDVSPQNVFLAYDGQVKVLDFGIAKMRDSEYLTQVGVIKGKLEYLAPEQLKGEELDGRADVFALGAMLWEAVTGQRFAGGRKVADVAKVHTRLSGGERKVRELKPDAPDEVVAIIERAIAILPSDRFESAGAFADAIEAYLEGVSSRPSAKTLSTFLSPLYEADRAKMRLVIEMQIERSQNGQLTLSGAEPPKIGPDSSSSSGVFVGGAGDSSALQYSTPSVGSARRIVVTAPSSSKTKYAWIALLLVAVAGVVVLRPWQRGEGVQREPMPQLPSPPPAVSATPAPAATPLTPVDEHESTAVAVLLDVKVTPADAEVTLDGAPLTTPFHGRFRKDSSFHLLEASAPGYRSFKRLVPFDSDQTLAIQLVEAPAPPSRRGARAQASDKRSTGSQASQAEPSPAPTVTTPPAVAAPEASEPGMKMSPSGSGIKRRTLIVSDPYAPKQ